jgi:hypothetical protein
MADMAGAQAPMATKAIVPGGVDQPGRPEPADAHLIGDIDLRDALEVELPRHPGGQHHFGRPIRRQAGHAASNTS